MIGECMLFVVLGFFVFPYQAKRLAYGNVFEMADFVYRVGR